MSRSAACPSCSRPESQGLPVPVNPRRDYITLNTREAPLDDVHARRALQYATDRQTLVDVVLFGVGIPATSFMPKGALYWNDTLRGLSLRPGQGAGGAGAVGNPGRIRHSS